MHTTQFIKCMSALGLVANEPRPEKTIITCRMFSQRGLKPDIAFAQSDQGLRCPLEVLLHLKLLKEVTFMVPIITNRRTELSTALIAGSRPQKDIVNKSV